MLAKCDRNVACERRLSGLANVGKHRNELGHEKAGVPVPFVLILIQTLEYPSSPSYLKTLRSQMAREAELKFNGLPFQLSGPNPNALG
jgi:hypothetical protein